MTNISKLPDRPVREWNTFSGNISRFMRANEADEDVIQHVLARLRTAFMNAANGKLVEIQAKTCGEAALAANVIFTNVVSGLLEEMAALAVENYHLGGGE